MKSPGRRQFLRFGSLLTLTATLPTLTACASPTPRPFITGQPISAPLGCQELLRRDSRGDC